MVALDKIVDEGHKFTTLNGRIKELTSVLIEIEKPQERCYIIPHRNNNIFATLAETMWVLGGRDNMSFLKKYLKRACDFSEDGNIWTGAYGKRLRDWYGVDQIEQLYLEATRNKYSIFSRRLVAVLYDPQRDYGEKILDCPCNNWIQFIVTPDKKLDMQVSLRANDIIWGFSGINQFEWSILHEMFAYWIDVEVGKYYHFVGSLDLFSRHFARAEKIINSQGIDIYEDKNLPKIKVDIKHDEFQRDMNLFFELELSIGVVSEKDFLKLLEKIDSLFIRNILMLLFAYNLYEQNKMNKMIKWFELIPYNDLKIVAAEYVSRKDKSIINKIIEEGKYVG
ncbi:MAG TPA: thymidylate synthase [Sedimentibacter sp.]|nr:thymidylate synthase [Sedimentibacter sp.]